MQKSKGKRESGLIVWYTNARIVCNVKVQNQNMST